MGLLAPPEPGSLLKDNAAKSTAKKNSGEKSAAKDKGNKRADTTEEVQADEVQEAVAED